MKTLIVFLLITAAFTVSAFSQTVKISEKDLKVIEGKKWVGDLTYLDYQSKKKTTIKSDLVVSRSKTDKLSWIFDMQYPLEPGANSTDTATLNADGTVFDGETVVERTKLTGGVLKIVTEKHGIDDNRDSTFRHTYLLSKKAFSIRKEVKFDGADEYFERNAYSWTR